MESTIPERLRRLGVTGILITAAEEGAISKLECAAGVDCLCPRELGGSTYFEPIPEPISDWIPTQDHITLKSEGGKLRIDNVQLMHRLCNRVRYTGEPGRRDRKRIEAAREMSLTGLRFRVMKGEAEVGASSDYATALARAQEMGADRVVDTFSRATITFQPR